MYTRRTTVEDAQNAGLFYTFTYIIFVMCNGDHMYINISQYEISYCDDIYSSPCQVYEPDDHSVQSL